MQKIQPNMEYFKREVDGRLYIENDWVKSYPLKKENNLCNMMMQYQIVKKYYAACLRYQF